ncbi:MAG: tripartite tricarboxylate transporter TctB family protein [Syntrophaceae bacterium]|nr:tripartite tricarboxylate transporter TctB family protein [Syntrophaceae bacterium]
MKKGERVFFGVCVAFFGFMLVHSLRLLGEGRPGEIGSGLWPSMAIGASLISSSALLFLSLRKRPEKSGTPAGPPPEPIAEKRRPWITVTLSALCFLVYLALMPFLGFILTTFLFIPAFAVALGERRKNVLIVSPFLLTAIIVAVFMKFIAIPFPKGVGIFAAFSRLF